MRYLFLLPLFALAACAIRVPRLEPLDGAWQYRNGHPLYTDSTQGVTAGLYWETFDHYHLMFQLSAYNGGSGSFEIDPAGCRLQPKVGSGLPDAWATNPEALLDNLDRQIRSQQRSNAVTSGFNALIALTDVVGSVSDATSKKLTKEERDKRDAEREDNARQIAADQARHQAQMANLQNEKAYWQNTLLRRTTLAPGQSIEGMVRFNRIDEADTVTIYCPSPDGDLQFRFGQRIVKE